MDNLAIILAIGTGFTFVCLFAVKRRAVRKFLGFMLIMLIIGFAVALLSK